MLALCLATLVACDDGRRIGAGRLPSQSARSSDGAVAQTDATANPLPDAGAPTDSALLQADAAPGLDARPPAPDAAASPADAGHRPPDASSVADSGINPDAGFTRYPACAPACNRDSDCNFDNGLRSQDNYRCVNLTCEYQGCTSDNECATALNDSSYGCAPFNPGGMPSCVKRCSTVNDCTMASELFGTDNYNCTGGYCRWTGCNSSTECATAYRDTAFVCYRGAGWPFASCVRSCTTRFDCDHGTPSADEDNYDCVSGICEWRGCTDDAECRAAYMDNSYVCR